MKKTKQKQNKKKKIFAETTNEKDSKKTNQLKPHITLN